MSFNQITLVNMSNPLDKWTFKFLENPVQDEAYTLIGSVPQDYHDYRSYYNDLVTEIFNKLSQDEAFVTQFVACDFSGSGSDAIDYFWQKMPGLWENKDLYKGRMVGYGGQDGTSMHPINDADYWYIEGSDPDTRYYVKFTYSSNSRAVYATVYDHNLNPVTGMDWTLDSDCTSIQPWVYSIPFIDDFTAFKAAANVTAANVYVGKMVTGQRNYQQHFDSETAFLYENVIYSYAISHSSNYYGWLWALYNNGGGDDPEPVDPTEDDPYKGDYGPSGPGGGGGGRDPYDKGDPLPYWDKPPVSICDTGLITLYTPSVTQLHLLAADIWSSNFVSSLVKEVYADPIEVIISVGIVPFNVTPAGTKKIKVGERELDITSNYPADNYVIFDMGSVSLQEALGAYTDYAPYTKGSIYIPYVGFVPLDVDIFMGHDIGLKYMVDLCTGSATACLLVDTDVHQVFNCNLLTPVPLTSANYSQMWQSLLSVGSALVGMEAAGLAGASAAGEFATDKALKSGAKSASDIMTGISTKPIIQKSNSLAGSGGLVGCPYAFIQIEHPALAIPTNQNRFIGYPSYMNSILSGLQGFTRVSSIHLGIAGATKRELVDIEQSLKNGVIIQASGAVTASGIGLINTADAANVIGKKMQLVADLTGAFRAEVDIVNPVVTIEKASAIGFNYVYIADFGRYYFVDEVRAVRNNILELHLSCDPLESFRTEILAHEAIIDKQEKVWNLYLNDDSLKSYQYPLIWQKKFPNAFWDNYEFVLVTAGA